MSDYETRAIEAEKNSEWWNAYRLWLLEGGDYGKENAAACKMIAESVDLSNRYRELVGNANQRWQNREINNRELYAILQEAHKEVYGK